MPERIGDNHQAENPVVIWLSISAVVVIVALTVWWVLTPGSDDMLSDYDLDPNSQEALITNSPAELGSISDDTPDIPLPEPEPVAPEQSALETPAAPVDQALAESEPEPAPQPDPIPDLEHSDPEIKRYFGALSSDTDYKLLWQTDNLLQRWVTVFDGASKGEIIKGVIGFQPPKEPFPVMRKGAKYYLSAKGFSRYDPMVKTLIAISPEQVSQGFHKFRPLLEQAYGQMGYDPEQLDNMLIKLLDRIIAAPVFPAGIELEAKSVNYTYVDPSIEALSPLEKQLIRTGPENTDLIQQFAKQLRYELLNP